MSVCAAQLTEATNVTIYRIGMVTIPETKTKQCKTVTICGIYVKKSCYSSESSELLLSAPGAPGIPGPWESICRSKPDCFLYPLKQCLHKYGEISVAVS